MWSLKQSEIKIERHDTWNPLMTLVGLVFGGVGPFKNWRSFRVPGSNGNMQQKTLELLSWECKIIRYNDAKTV